LAIGAPSGPAAGAPGATGGVAPSPLTAGNVPPPWLNAGAAEAQPWGTDNTPSEAARPALAATAASPIPDELKAPVPEPMLLSVDPNAPNPLPKALVVEPKELMNEPAVPRVVRPDVNIDEDDAVPDTRLVPDVTAVDDEVRVVKDDSGDVEDEVDVAADTNALGITALLSGADNVELSGDTICTPVPAEVPAACVTAALSPANPAGLVVSSGVVKAVNVDAAEAAPA
jgi:hypothetical protein